MGPTASGKSALALSCAEEFGGEIINGDSLQVFSSLDIGTAKPTRVEQEKVKHHLIDIVPEGGSFTAGDFRRFALQVIESAEKAGAKHIYVVGGSGFYIQALVSGMYDLPKPSSEVKKQVQDLIEQRGWDVIYREVISRDPVFAQRLKANDHYRIQRALEMIFSSGKTMTEILEDFEAAKLAKNPFPFHYICVGLDLPVEELRKNVEARTRAMLLKGWVDEVKSVLDRGLANWEPMKSVGYNEICCFLAGTLPEEKLVDQIVTRTLQLAKRQRTWFRNKVKVDWFRSSDSVKAKNFIGEFLDSSSR